MLIPFRTFTGEYPKLKSHLLPDNAAQSSTDCDFLAGSLRGLKNNDPIAGISGTGIRSIFVYDGGAASGRTFWWNRDVDAVRSPVVDDQYARFYWSDGSAFYVSRGDIGGNGEPSTTNRYKVGVPRPASAFSLGAEGAKIAIPGATGLSLEVCDEKSDGTFANCESVVGAVAEHTATVFKTVFTARAPAAVSNSGTTTTTETPKQVTGTWIAGGTVRVGGPDGPIANRYYLSGNYSGFVIYYEDPLIQPATINFWDANEVNYSSGYPRLGNTFWYGSSASLTPPTQVGPTNPASTTTTVSAPVTGPVVKLTILRPSGNLNAVIRTDSNKTTWPIELPGYSAYLTVSGTSYTVTISVAAGSIEHRAYTYTYVNQYGEESAPADPLEIDCAESTAIDLRYPLPPPGYCPITKLRVYRTAPGVASDYLYVGEASVNTTNPSFVDTVRNEALGHTLDTNNYYPPDQSLQGITVMANGIMVGFKGNEVHFSEPYLPYAWNPSAIKPFPHRVVGICPFEGGLYVTTAAEPYIIQGAAPEFMTDMRIASTQAGVSKGSICNYNGQVVYASSDGIVQLQGTQTSLDMSFKFFSRHDWYSRYGTKLSNMRLDVHDGSLLVWFDDGTPGFLLRFEEENPSLTTMSEAIYASYLHPIADALYVSNGNSVFEFRGANTRKSLVWHSKDFITPKPTNFGAVQLVGSGSLTLTVYADGAQVTSQAVAMTDTGRVIVRLPSGFMARRWSLKVQGAAEINEMYLSNSVAELQSV